MSNRLKIETWHRRTFFSGTRYYLHISAGNGEIIMTSEAYNSEASRDHAVKLLLRVRGEDLQVIDLGEVAVTPR